MRFQHRLIQLLFIQATKFQKRLLMDAVEHGLDFSRTWILFRIGIGYRFSAEQSKEALRDQVRVRGPRPTDSFQGKPVLRHRQVADLPGNVADAAWREPEPVRCRRLLEQA